MRRARVLFAAAAAVITWWTAIFAITQQASVITGLYWALTTATTVGYGDVTARGTSGHMLAIGCQLTTIPLLAAAFSAIHLDMVKTHLERRLAEHHHEIHAHLDELGKDGKP